MALTDTQVRKAKPGEAAYKLFDTAGLYLYVTPAGFKSWRMKYRFAGKERRLTFGPYPDVSLVDARDRRDDARRMLRDHRDPATEERKRKATAHASHGATFEPIAREWYEAQKPIWSPVHQKKVIQAFERDVFKEIGALPIADIDGPMLLSMLRKVERRGSVDSAKRIRQHVSAVFCFAKAQRMVAVDPAADIGRALIPIAKKGKQPALRTLEQARELLAAMDASTSSPLTKLASRLLALTVVRPGVVRAARWAEFEGIDWADPDAEPEAPIWRVPAERMKLDLESKDEEDFDHIVPLPPQAVEVLRAVHRLTGRIDFLFPSARSTRAPMSENAIGYMYVRNGYRGRHVPHGWRSTFSTVMNERAVNERRPDDRGVIDAMLAHRPKGMSGSEMAYNRALYMPRRIELAREWADLLCGGLPPANELLRGQST